MTYDFVPYAIIEGYCILFSLIVLFQLNGSLGSEHEVRQLKNMIYTYMVLLAGDIVFALVEGGTIQIDRALYTIDNAVVVFAISLGCYFWYRFVEDRLHPTYTFSRTYRILRNIPIFLILILDIVSIFTGWMFFVDANGHYQDNGLFIIQSVINFGYALIPSVASLYRAARTHSRLHRTEYAMYAVYILAPIVASLLEDTLPNVPILAMNILIVIILLFLTLQNLQISSDALTGLNNRRRLNRYLEERLQRASEDDPVILFILDINRFKSINDRFGHIEGDNALRTFAAALRTTASKHNAFAARYGGDEFCLVSDAFPGASEIIATDIAESLREARADTGRSVYELSTSLGYAVRSEAGYDVNAFIAEADAMLYKNKKSWHLDER